MKYGLESLLIRVHKGILPLLAGSSTSQISGILQPGLENIWIWKEKWRNAIQKHTACWTQFNPPPWILDCAIYIFLKFFFILEILIRLQKSIHIVVIGECVKFVCFCGYIIRKNLEEEAYKTTQIIQYTLPGTLKTSYKMEGDVHTRNISKENSGNKTPFKKKSSNSLLFYYRHRTNSYLLKSELLRIS